jgi:hypothetical protein
MTIITCPYCYQKIDSLNKEKPLENKSINIKCPKCTKIFKFYQGGVERLEYEMRFDSIRKSIRVLVSHY